MAEVGVDRSLLVDFEVVPEDGLGVVHEQHPEEDTAAVPGSHLGHKSEAASEEGHAVEGSGAVSAYNSGSVEESAVHPAAGPGSGLGGNFVVVLGSAHAVVDCTATLPVVASEYNFEAGRNSAVERGMVSEMSAGEDTEAGLEVDPEYTTHPATGASAAEA
jgi:hypothetical protein